MSDSIYTLLIIAWVVFGIYKAVNKNKNKAQSGAPQAKASNQKPFESILEDLLQGNQSNNQNPYYKADFEDIEEELDPRETEEVVEMEMVNQEAEQKSKLDTYSGSDNFSPVTQEVETETNVDTKDKGEDVVEAKNEAIDENAVKDDINFDLRQAIISQIILERPYK
jgi:hypothetical protein